MASLPAPGELMWAPPEDARDHTEIGRSLVWLATELGLDFAGYDDLWRWSVADSEGFWGSIWDFHEIRSQAGYDRVLGSRQMPGAEWFPGARLNYAEHMLGAAEDADRVAVVAHSQTRPPIELTFAELRDQVARARAGLQRLGVGRGDRVAAYLPNIPETLVAFLATASLGAIWASCAPEFGARSVIDRFSQVEPKILLAVSGYNYGARTIDRTEEVAAIRRELPTAEHFVDVPYAAAALPDALSWFDLLSDGELDFEQVPFQHPLYVLFSSGTTGKPKALVHGCGGTLVEHLKNHALSWDLKAGDRLLWFTTTAWMMWNVLVSALLVRASIVTIDGNPLYPDLNFQWELAEQTGATLMGASPGFLMACRQEGIEPTRLFHLELRQLGVAGSPLPLEGFAWVYEQFGDEVLLNLGSGGTDVCSGLVQGNPLLPVWAGEISGRCLGVDAKAFDAAGRPVVGELGELVITTPMPSMPVGFWNDEGHVRYRATYFDHFPGVWRHGDWIRFTERGSCVITGRSDATLNRGGVRLGTAEFYRVVEELPEVSDSLVVHLEDPLGGQGELILFVVTRDGVDFDEELRQRIGSALRSALSPRHVPDTLLSVRSVPRNLTGKKLELPIKRILLGEPVDDVVSLDVLADPSALDSFLKEAPERRQRGPR
jgi:acetoacetyl-CoA synthetase